MRELLELLEHDGRRSIKELATMLGRSEYEIEEQMKKLEKEKIILGYNTMIDWEKYGDDSVSAMLVVMIGWVFFSQTDFGALGHYLGTMFGIGASGFIDKTALYYLKTGFILLLISILMCRPAPYQYFKRLVRRRPVAAVIINLILFALSIAYMVYNSYTPFLYAKF